jgi:undecaprenyl-phosphate 4-deoxy-4-formamido-L-arabinose transferase
MEPHAPRRQASPRHGASDEGLLSGVSVVVPCYNSELTLGDLVHKLAVVLPGCAEAFEAILVNDDSHDGTWDLIVELAQRYPWVRGINLMRNYGQHNATLCGARAARHTVTVTLDDDLQNPPEEIPKLLDKLAEGHDLVYGTTQSIRQSFYRYVLSWLMRLAVAIATRQRVVRDLSAFRAYRTSLRRAFADFRSPHLLIDVLLGWGTTRIAATQVRHDQRRKGQSNYGLLQLINAALLLWTGYTTAPLRLATFMGFSFVAFGLAILVYVLSVYFLEGSLPGFPFLASTIAIFGGVQLFTLGIIGEYVARMFDRSLDQPVYLVKEVVEGDDSTSSA